MGSLRKLTVRHLFLVVPIAGLAWAVSTPLRDNSFLWHVRAGTLQLERGRVLTTDPFSMEFAGEPWRTQSWLADILFGSLESAFAGLGYVGWYRFSVAFAAVGLTLGLLHSRARHLAMTAAAGFVLVWQAIPFSNPRPVLFSYALLAAVSVALHRRADWAVPGLMWLWAALHGSFVIGLTLIALEAVRTRSRRLGEVAAASAVLATLTAHGVAIWTILIDFLGNRGALDMIQEWQPPDYTNPFMLPYGLLLLATIYAAATGGIDRRDLIVLLPFLFFGLLAVRNIMPALIVVLPYTAAGLIRGRAEVRPAASPLVAYAGLAIVVAGLLGLLRPVRLSEAAFPPPTAMEVVTSGPLFHGIGPGGYLIYAEWPERPVLVDDRAELYGADGFERYTAVADGIGWRDLFSELGISQALLDPDWALVDDLREAGWVELYRDEWFIVARAP